MDISPPSPIYVCAVCGGVPDIGGSAPGFWLSFWILSRKKNNPLSPSYAHRPGSPYAPDRLDWVQMWVQQSGLMPICPGSQAHFRREVVWLLTPRLYIRGVHALPFNRQLRLALCLDLGRVTKLSEPRQSYASVGIAIAGGV